MCHVTQVPMSQVVLCLILAEVVLLGDAEADVQFSSPNFCLPVNACKQNRHWHWFGMGLL